MNTYKQWQEERKTQYIECKAIVRAGDSAIRNLNKRIDELFENYAQSAAFELLNVVKAIDSSLESSRKVVEDYEREREEENVK